jgi:hypothetical protein
MKIIKSWLCLAAALLVFWTACKKEDNNIVSGSSNWPGATVKASFIGQVMDENDQPVADAVARVGTKQAKTDKNGIFIINNQSVNSARAIVTVFKAGFWDGSRTLFVAKNSQNRVNFRLLKKTKSGSITGSTGGKVSVAGGAEIEFPANSVTRNGTIFSGKVNVTATFIDPRSANIFETMPGDLRGIRTSGDEEILTTFGMLGVELTDDSGQEIKIATGQKATISTDIAPDLLQNAPATVPLWHFDVQNGIWVEDGIATKIGSKYVGEVSHFSWWNYDVSVPGVKLSGHIVDQNGNALTNLSVWICPENLNLGWGCGHGALDSSNFFCGLAPKDVVLRVSVHMAVGACLNGAVKEIIVGPFAADTDLGNIVVDLSTNAELLTTSVSGRLVDCNGQPIANGYLKSNLAGFIIADGSGNFSFSATYCSLNAPTSTTIQGFDFVNLKESQILTLPISANVNFGDVTVCDDVDEYVRYSVDGGAEQTCFASLDSSSIFQPNIMYVTASDPTKLKTISFSFNHNNVPENGLLLNYLYVENTESSPTNFNVKTNMTSYPTAVGDYLIGTFSGSYLEYTTLAPHSITGSYRIKRNF